jgi:hypothetical protein
MVLKRRAMKMRNRLQNRIRLMSLVLSLIVVASCKKDDDSAYQQKGNYPTIYSKQFTVTWTLNAPGYFCTISDANITQAVVDNGYVEVYLSNGSGGWIALPITMPVTSTYATTYTPVHYLGGITIWAYDTDTQQTEDPGSTTFKVVIISAVARLANPTLNVKNYEEVKSAFNL